MNFSTILAEMITQERAELRRVSKVTMSFGYYVKMASSLDNYIVVAPDSYISKLLGVEIDVIPEDMDMWYTVEVEPLE